MDLLINLTNNGNNAASPWANLVNDSTTAVVIPAPDGSDSGWTVANDDTVDAGLAENSNLGQSPTSSNASWVSDIAAEFAYTLTANENYFYKLLLTGPANTDFVLEAFSSSDSDENPKWKVNGSAVQSLSELNNTTNVLTFSATTDSAGDAFVEFAKGGGFCRANAMRIILPDSPSATLDNGPVEPGKAITGTYVNFASEPTAQSIADASSNAISSASEITDLVIDDAAKTFSFTFPARITSGTGTTLLRGPVTLELT